MGVIITQVKLSKNPAKVGEQLKITVAVKESAQEPVMYRLPFRLGKEKGGIK